MLKVISQTDSMEYLSYYKRLVYSLADDSLKGREASTVYEKKAANLLINEFKKIKNFKPQTQIFTYKENDTIDEKTAANVYCFVNQHADSTIVISAHYDHIGLGGHLSFARSIKNKIHNGADDNASGVALMLGLAKSFYKWNDKKYNYIFVSYSAHESGLYGSNAFYNYIKTKVPPIKLVLNFDMVGRLDNDNPILNVYGFQKVDVAMQKRISYPESALVVYTNEISKIFVTDCKWYVENNISGISITTGIHNDYHKPTDDASDINYPGIYIINQFVLRKILVAAKQ